MATHRFIYAKNGAKDIGLPLLSFWMFHYTVSKRMWTIGLTKMSKEDFYEQGKKGYSRF